MKTYRFLGILVAAVVLPLAGCDNVVDEVPDAGNDQKVVVKFTGGWGDGPARTTWEGTNTGFTVKWKGKNDVSSDDTFDKVGIYAKNINNATVITNACYHPTTSEASSPLEIDQGQETALNAGVAYDFYSYYPYNPGYTTMEFDISGFWEQKQSAPNESTHIPEYDLLRAVSTLSITENTGSSSVNFEYKHLFSCLQFEITNTRKKAITIESLKLNSTGDPKALISPTKLGLASESMHTPYAKSISLTISQPKAIEPSETQIFWMMMCPVSNGQVELNMYRRGQNTPSSITMTTPEMKAGANYIIKLKLTGDEKWSPTLEYNNLASQ